MLNIYTRPVALSIRARLLWRAVPLAIFGVLAWPMAYAAEPMAMPAEMVMAPAPALSQYQKWRDDPVSDWIQSNDRVGEIGGWLTYLRDAQPDDGAAGPSNHSHHGH
ncbi:MAG TPA: hypothetical protein VIN38_13000 [Thiobacillus sp.]